MPRGYLITFEGSEGSGKSTQIAKLEESLKEAGREVILTREPGGTPLGERIRHLLKFDIAGENMCPEAELLLFAASRAQIVRELVNPAIVEGKIVLCDRFLDSTTVYQGVARQISADAVTSINKFAIGTRKPDMTILIDIPAEVGLARARVRQGEGQADRMEQEAVEFYENVRKGYRDLAKAEPKRFFVVDGTLPKDTIASQISAQISDRLSI